MFGDAGEVCLLSDSRWTRQLNAKNFKQAIQHFQKINVDEAARRVDAHAVAGRIHNLIMARFKSQDDLIRPQREEGLGSGDSTDEESLSSANEPPLEDQPADQRSISFPASLSASNLEPVRVDRGFGRQNQSNDLERRSPGLQPTMDQQTQGLRFHQQNAFLS